MAHSSDPWLVPQTFLDLLSLVLSQLPCIANTEAMLEDLRNFLKIQARNFGVKQNDQNPADTTDSSIETKCTRRSHSFHHGQEG